MFEIEARPYSVRNLLRISEYFENYEFEFLRFSVFLFPAIVITK